MSYKPIVAVDFDGTLSLDSQYPREYVQALFVDLQEGSSSIIEQQSKHIYDLRDNHDLKKVIQQYQTKQQNELHQVCLLMQNQSIESEYQKSYSSF